MQRDVGQPSWGFEHMIETVRTGSRDPECALELLPAAAYTCDADGLITSYNQKAVDLWGRAPKLRDPQDRFCGSFRLYAPDGSPIAHERCWMALSLEQGRGFNRQEIVIERPNGERVFALAHANPVRDAQGQLLGALNVLVDITEQKHAEATRAALESRLRHGQKMEAIGLLAGGVAHDFNNALAMILGHAELAQRKLDQGHPAFSNLSSIASAVLRARDVVAQLLTFSRARSISHAPTHMNQLVAEALAVLRSALPQDVELIQELCAEEVWVRGDGAQLQQLLLNLCTNAAHALRDKPGHIRVNLRRASLPQDADPDQELVQGPYVVLSVEDDGLGIEPEIRERMFEPFFTTKPVGQGAGLGLAVAHGIVKEHGGTIRALGNVGQGTTVEVHLPECAQGLASYRSSSAMPPKSPRARILFVDDQAPLVELAKAQLAPLGLDVIGVTSAKEALAVFRAAPESFALVASDQTMPGMTGLQLAGELRHIRRRLPFLLITGHDAGALEHALGDPARSRCVQKPVSARELAHAVRTLLGSEQANEKQGSAA